MYFCSLKDRQYISWYLKINYCNLLYRLWTVKIERRLFFNFYRFVSLLLQKHYHDDLDVLKFCIDSILKPSIMPYKYKHRKDHIFRKEKTICFGLFEVWINNDNMRDARKYWNVFNDHKTKRKIKSIFIKDNIILSIYKG